MRTGLSAARMTFIISSLDFSDRGPHLASTISCGTLRTLAERIGILATTWPTSYQSAFHDSREGGGVENSLLPSPSSNSTAFRLLPACTGGRGGGGIGVGDGDGAEEAGGFRLEPTATATAVDLAFGCLFRVTFLTEAFAMVGTAFAFPFPLLFACKIVNNSSS